MPRGARGIHWRTTSLLAHRLRTARHRLLGSIAALAACALAHTQAAADAQAGAAPPGLAVLWAAPERLLPDRRFASSIAAFSSDGELVAVADAGGVQMFRTRDGALVRALAWGYETAHSLAVSAAGDVAVGRVGAVVLYAAGSRVPRRIECADVCGPVGAAAFSPDGALLAFQGARGRDDRRRGLGAVRVVDAKSGASVVDLAASAARARVRFSADGRRLIAAHTMPFDERELFGARAWRVGDWRLTEQLIGARRVARSEGSLARAAFAAAFEHDGAIEIRDLVTDGVVWSRPLVQPAVDARPSAESAELEIVEIAPEGKHIVSYESPELTATGTIVVRSAAEGAIEAMYDVPHVTALAIAPDGKSFVYAAGLSRRAIVLARLPF